MRKDVILKDNMEYIDGTLHISGVNIKEIADRYGTPLYVYDRAGLVSNITNYNEAFKNVEHLICYAVKANYNRRIIELFKEEGAGADVVSGGELYMAVRAGIAPSKIVFAGVGKSFREIKEAVKAGVLQINIESRQELMAVNDIAGQMGETANIALRINPDIDSKTHPKISTGLKESKFGIHEERAVEIYKEAARMENAAVKGVHLHIGSQITEMKPFDLAASAAVNFTDRLKKEGIELENIDIGGGLGIGYETSRIPTAADIYDTVNKYFGGRKEKLILEPGRSLAGNAGYLLTKVEFVKKGAEKNFVVVDAGFNDLIRPAMYDAYHEIVPVNPDGETMVADVVGPVCETGDHIALNRKVAGIKQGNILAICDSGAYGFSMASNYNSRLRPAEVIIDSGAEQLIRTREAYSDLVRNEV